METNVRLPRRMRRYFSSICVLSVFVMVFLGPGAIISTLAQALTFLNFGNFMGAIGNMVRSLTGFGKGGPCHFKCPDGSMPRPNPVHASTTNGCGVFGFQVDSQLFPAVTTCCEKHDICYDKCNSDKSKCDIDFQTCLRMICKNLHKATGGTELYEGCVSIADLAYKATDAAGCKTFLESQSNACICDGSRGTDGKPPPPGWKGTDQNSTTPPNADTATHTNLPPDKSGSTDPKDTSADSFSASEKKKSGSFDDLNKKSKNKDKSQEGKQENQNSFGQEDSQGNVIYDHANIIKTNMDKTNNRQRGKYEDRKKDQKGSGKKKHVHYNDEEFDSDEDSDIRGGKLPRRKGGKRRDEF